jgi:hypothetical protein
MRLAWLDAEEAGIESAYVILDLLFVNVHCCDSVLWRGHFRVLQKAQMQHLPGMNV